MSEKVLIIDSGMKNLGGHNFTYTRAVQSALEQRGFTVTVFANKNLSDELAKETSYRPVFTFGAYDFPSGHGRVRALMQLYAQARTYSRELESALEHEEGDDYALVFCHTVNDFELMGWRRFLSRHQLTGHLMIVERLTPGFQSCHPLKLSWHPYWRIKPHYLNRIYHLMRGRFTLLTDSELLTQDYAHIYRQRIVTLPIPISESVVKPNGRNSGSADLPVAQHELTRDRPIRIGYMGDARGAKGFPVLSELVRRVLSETSENVRFVIQCPPSASGVDDGQPEDGVTELKQLAQTAAGRVTLIAERLSERAYTDLFHDVDIVILPYLAAYYAQGTAGIFAEALALSKPVVVSGGTWMSRELKKSGGGEEFQSGDVVDLTAKVLQVVRRYDEYAAKAQRFSAEWRAFHNPDTLVDVLLREIQPPINSSRRVPTS